MKPSIASMLARCVRTTPVVAALALAFPAHAEPIDWSHHGIQDALDEAASCDGHVLVDVYATWCGPCRRLDREVFVAPGVELAAEGMIAVKIDAESGNGPQVVDEYHVVGFPTVLVLDATGRELDRIFGYMPPDEFAEALRSARFGPRTFGEIFTRFRRIAERDGLVQTGFDRGFHAATCGNYEVAETLLRRVVDADPSNERGLGAAALLAIGKYRYLRGERNYDAAIAEFAGLRSRFRESPEADEALIQSAVAHARAGRTDSARAAFDVFLQADPDDPARANDVAFSMLREGIELDRALEIARRAAELAPEEHPVWDTLAEIHFARGDAELAIEAIDHAIELDSANEYYRDQRARFIAAR